MRALWFATLLLGIMPASALAENAGRNLVRLIDGLFFYVVGMISVMLSQQNKRLGDYVAGTVVIHDQPTSEVKPDWSFSQPTEAAFRPELSNVSEQDLIVIETFLHRRLDLQGMVRLNTAIRLCELIQHKTGLTKLQNQSDEEFLETLARQVRDRARLRT